MYSTEWSKGTGMPVAHINPVFNLRFGQIFSIRVDGPWCAGVEMWQRPLFVNVVGA